MPTIRIQTMEEVARSFVPPGRRAVREEELRPYREAVSQLGPETPGVLLNLRRMKTHAWS